MTPCLPGSLTSKPLMCIARLLLIIFAVLIFERLQAQRTDYVQVAKQLAENMKRNANNPLNIDSNWLMQLADVLPAGTLKTKIVEYTHIMNREPEVSFRQIYWDVYQSINSNIQSPELTKYLQTQQSIDVLINQSNLVVNALKGDLRQVTATEFFSHPQFITTMSDLTGSTDLAIGISQTAGKAIEVWNAVKAAKKWKEEYSRNVALSKKTVYPETNAQLGAALIDAYVGTTFRRITSIYRYDFDNGSSLLIEDGSLQWVNKSRTAKKKLFDVAVRNNGDPNKRPAASGSYVKVSPDEKVVMFFTGTEKCSGCLSKNRVYLLDSETGEELGDYSFVYDTYTMLPLGLSISRSVLQFWEFNMNADGKKISLAPGKKKQHHDEFLGISKEARFLINGVEKKARAPFWDQKVAELPNLNLTHIRASSEDFVSFSEILDVADGTQPENMNPADPNNIMYATLHCSSFLQASDRTGKKKNLNFFINKLTSITADSKGNLYVAGANGAMMKINTTTVTDPNILCDSIELGLSGNNVLTPYDYKERRTPKLFAVNNHTPVYLQPTLTLTPDEQWLVYSIKDELFMINAKDVTKVKKYKLRFRIADYFFAKENGAYTIHILGENEFMLPVVKKYSISKLVENR